MSALMVREINLIEQFRDLSLVCEMTPDSVKLGMLKLTNNFLDEIREGQKFDVELVDHRVLVNQGKTDGQTERTIHPWEQIKVEFYLPSTNGRSN